jgi:hypothetical protein
VRKIRQIPNNSTNLKYLFISLSSFLSLKNNHIFTENSPKNQIILFKFHTNTKKAGGLAVIAIHCLRTMTLRPILSDSLPLSTFY